MNERAIALTIAKPTLGPEQTIFNELLNKIDTLGNEIKELQQLGDLHVPARRVKMAPLIKENQALDEKLVLFLSDRLQTPKGLSKNQQLNLADIAVKIGESILQAGYVSETLETEINRLCAEYFGDDENVEEDDDLGDDDLFADENREIQMEHMAEMIRQNLGIELDAEIKFTSPEEIMGAAFKKHQAEQAARAQAQEARRAKRKKSKKELLAEQESMDADSALRLIYRKLAAALHPDREPDEAERARKTKLMALVNTANDNKDLLTLLRLQLETEQINPEAIAALADDKLRHYNRVLKEQLRTVQQEHQQLMQRLRYTLQIARGPISEKTIQAALRSDLQTLKQQLEMRENELSYIQTTRQLKVWLNQQLEMLERSFDFGF